jgi:hypothetical protein
MSTRILSLRRGKNGDVQSFSRARPPHPGTVSMIQSTICPGINDAHRLQIWSDPGNVYQFACVYGDMFGFFTRPVLVPGGVEGDASMLAVGSFTDTIGEPLPCSVKSDDFYGHFTTLVRREDAHAFGLAIHPTTPDTIEGPSAHGRAFAATMERLGFPLPDNPGDGDYPVIAALPCFLPIGPGLTFPHPLPANDARTFRDTFPLFEVWRRGVLYAKDHNEGSSVTLGGPLFRPSGVAIPEGDDNPFATLLVRPLIVSAPPVQLLPTSALYSEARERILAWSDTIWVELGEGIEPDPVPVAAVGGFTPDHFRAAMEPLVPKEKTFTSAGRTMARYRLLLAGLPSETSALPSHGSTRPV